MTKHGKIDKSQLEFGIDHRVKDDAYRKSFDGETCIVCGRCDGTVIGAHIRTGHEGGTSLKPSDDLLYGLCGPCHAAQEANPGPDWWINNLPRWLVMKGIKMVSKLLYKEWKK